MLRNTNTSWLLLPNKGSNLLTAEYYYIEHYYIIHGTIGQYRTLTRRRSTIIQHRPLLPKTYELPYTKHDKQSTTTYIKQLPNMEQHHITY